MDLIIHTLDNGIRLVHAPVPGIVAHCGIIINAGSRDESEGEHGIAHFIEHMLFKGTKKRNSYHILSRLEDVGGELNAYTTKEDTAVYASFLRDDYERAAELLADITFNSVYPEKEIKKEKDVVIEEINSYLDTPAELIFDEFEEQIFDGLPVGRSILGKPDSVRSFSRKKITEFISKNYRSDQIVFSSVGNIPMDKILKLFKTNFGSVRAGKKEKQQSPLCIYKQSFVRKKKDTYQNHCIIGNQAFSIRNEKRMGMFLLNNILGGQGLNSRLNLALREKNGLAYSVESNYTPYSDSGSLSIYFGTDKQYLGKSISIVNKELEKLCTVRLGTIQLSNAKRQIKGYIARGYENHENLMLSLGKSLLTFDKIETLEETYKKIDVITSSQLLDIANQVFDKSALSTLIYG